MSGLGNGAPRPRAAGRRRQAPPLPRRPYRDSALLHGVLAAVIVVVTLVTGGSIVTGVLVAAAYFVTATAWSWVRFSQRLREVEHGPGGTGREADR